MDTELQNLASQYFDIEATILKRIEYLPEYGEDCKCEEQERFFIVDDDNIIGYCLNCGGSVS